MPCSSRGPMSIPTINFHIWQREYQEWIFELPDHLFKAPLRRICAVRMSRPIPHEYQFCDCFVHGLSQGQVALLMASSGCSCTFAACFEDTHRHQRRRLREDAAVETHPLRRYGPSPPRLLLRLSSALAPSPMIVISATATFSSWNAMPAGTMWGKTSPGTAAKSRRISFVGQKAFVFPLVRSPDSCLPSRSVQGDFHPDSYGLHLCGEFHHDDQDKELGGQEAVQDAVVTLIVR